MVRTDVLAHEVKMEFRDKKEVKVCEENQVNKVLPVLQERQAM